MIKLSYYKLILLLVLLLLLLLPLLLIINDKNCDTSTATAGTNNYATIPTAITNICTMLLQYYY